MRPTHILPLLLAIAACTATPTPLPPGPLVAVKTGDSGTILLPRARAFDDDRPVTSRYDTATDSTTVAVVTHAGRYFLWIQRPRITVRFRYAGHRLATVPSDVIFDVRVQHPQQPDVSTLELAPTGGGRPVRVSRVTFHLKEDVLVTNLDYAFDVPVAAFARLIRSGTLALTLGGVKATFDGRQMEALRDLASRMVPGRN